MAAHGNWSGPTGRNSRCPQTELLDGEGRGEPSENPTCQENATHAGIASDACNRGTAHAPHLPRFPIVYSDRS